mgnify:CR=1 FL=1
MEYYRELIDRLVDGKFKPLIVGKDIKKYYGPIIDMAEDFEKETGKRDLLISRRIYYAA